MGLLRTLGAMSALCAALSLLASQSCLAAKVGVAAAVNPDAFSGGKQIRIGKSIFYNERIRTDANGVVQVLLVDGSTFTVGRNSNVVIDRFVYDPNKKTGELVASFSKGSLRYVGGKISKNPDSVKVKTPNGSLAIRGGMFQGTAGGRSSIFSFLFGEEMIFRGWNGKTYTVYQPGYTLDFSSGTPTIRPTTAQDVQRLMASLSNGNTNTAGVETENTPPAPSYIFTTLNMQQLIIDATRTRIGDDVYNQLADIDTSIGYTIGGYGSGLIYSSDIQDFSFASSTEPSDFSFNPATQILALTLRDVEGGGTVTHGTFRFSPTTQNHWALSSIALYEHGGSDLYIVNSSGYATEETGLLCTNCSFIKWGAFGAEFEYLTANQNEIQDQIEPGWWVGGYVTDFADLPTTGTASYSGKAVGSIAIPQTSSSIVGRGDLGMTWNFAKRSGRLSITDFNANPSYNLPDLNVSGTMTMPGRINRFSGDIGGRAGSTPVSGGAYGSFVTDGKRPAAGVIGDWGVSGANGYRATGVFGGVSAR